MKAFKPLTEEERLTIQKTVDVINESIAIPCTGCHYCTDECPKHIAIPEYFGLYNNQRQFGYLAGMKSNYLNLTSKYGKPDDCIKCGLCESHCPQHLPIREYLDMAARELG